ncbi:MAG: lactonase family protein [Acidobacteriaceae bacterium]
MTPKALLQPVNFPKSLSRRGFMKGASTLAIAQSQICSASIIGDNTRRRRMFAYVGTNTIAGDGAANGKGIYLFGMDPSTGELSCIKLAAATNNPSWLALHPAQPYLYTVHEVADYEGKSGAVSAYAINRASGDLQYLNTVSSQGAGPAHLSVDTSGKYVFVANYGGGSIAVLPILPDGKLGAATFKHQDSDHVGSKKPTSAPPGSFAFSGHDAPHAHMIASDPSNRFVIRTDLGQDRIYVYHLDASTGMLTAANSPFVTLPTGDGPRHFAFHPNRRWMYSVQEEASTVVLFHFDPETGSLSSQQTISTLPHGFTGTNFCSEILVSRDGCFLYVGNRLHNTIAVFSIGERGRLHLVGEAPTLGDYPRQFNIDPGGKFLYACNQRSDQITSFRINSKTGELAFTGQYTPVGTPTCILFMAAS